MTHPTYASTMTPAERETVKAAAVDILNTLAGELDMTFSDARTAAVAAGRDIQNMLSGRPCSPRVFFLECALVVTLERRGRLERAAAGARAAQREAIAAADRCTRDGRPLLAADHRADAARREDHATTLERAAAAANALAGRWSDELIAHGDPRERVFSLPLVNALAGA